MEQGITKQFETSGSSWICGEAEIEIYASRKKIK